MEAEAPSAWAPPATGGAPNAARLPFRSLPRTRMVAPCPFMCPCPACRRDSPPRPVSAHRAGNPDAVPGPADASLAPARIEGGPEQAVDRIANAVTGRHGWPPSCDCTVAGVSAEKMVSKLPSASSNPTPPYPTTRRGLPSRPTLGNCPPHTPSDPVTVRSGWLTETQAFPNVRSELTSGSDTLCVVPSSSGSTASPKSPKLHSDNPTSPDASGE